jgi:hypothetical protein
MDDVAEQVREQALRARPRSARTNWCQPISLIVSRPAEYRGVSMRSQLEADFAHWLDSKQVRWDYEPEYFGGPGEGYLPDFRIVRDDSATYVEVKPTIAEVPRAQERLELVWQRHPDATLLVVCGEGNTFYAALKDQPWESWTERWKHR